MMEQPQVAYGHSLQQKYPSEYKRQLVDTFRGFSGNTVSGISIQFARECIQYGGMPQHRYQYIRFDGILDLNREVPSYLTMMTSAYDLLLKYVINLLKNKRPQVWRSIKTNNTAFKARVSCMNGSTEILQTVGYTVARENAMCFPDDVEEPDKERLFVIAAELLMAKLEVEQMNKGTPPNPSGSPPKVRTMIASSQQQNPPSPQHPRTDLMYTSNTSYPPQHTNPNTGYLEGVESSRMRYDPELSLSPSHQQLSNHNQYTGGYQPRYSGPVNPPVSSGPGQSYLKNNMDTASLVPMPPSNGVAVSPGMSDSVEPSVSPGKSFTPQSTPTDQKRPIPKPRTNVHKLQSPQTPPPSHTQPSHHTPCPQVLEEDVHSSLGSHHSSSGDLSNSRQSSISSADGSESSSSRPNSGKHASSVTNSVADRVKSIRERRENIKKGMEKPPVPSSPVNSGKIIPMSGRAKFATEVHTPRVRLNQIEMNQSKSPDVPQRSTAGYASLADLSSDKMFKRPPSKKQPSFYNDTILESQETTSVVEPQGREHPVSQIPSQQPQQQINRPVVQQRQQQIDSSAAVEVIPPIPDHPRFCSDCKNKLEPGHIFCGYCGVPANSSSNQPTTPDPPSSSVPVAISPEVVDDDPPLRASHQDALKAEEHHRTRVIQLSPEQTIVPMVTQPFTPVRREIPRESADKSEPPQPERPPKPRPRQDHKHVQPAPLVPPRQTNRSELPPGSNATPSSQTTPPLPPKQRLDPMAPPKNIHGESSEGASGGSELSSIDFQNMPGIAHLREKEEAFKQKQRKDGVKEQDIKPLDELEKAKRKYVAETRDKRRQTQVPPPVKQTPDEHSSPRQQKKQKQKPDVSKFERKDLTQSNHTEYPYDPGEVKRLDELGNQGRQLLDSIKECTRFGYSLDEVQIAFNSRERKSTLAYLQQDWRHKTENIQRNISMYTTSDRQSVGTPGTMETREALTKAGGVVGKAEAALFKERVKRVNELLGRVQHMRAANEDIPALPWEDAVRVLSANYMDVDMAFYSLQCDWLQPLYEYIFDESKTDVMVHAKEMEQIKAVVRKKDLDQEAHLRLLMTECRFENEETANIVLQLLEEVEGNGDAEYPLQYYIDAAKDHKDLESARSFLIKECEICIMAQTIHEFVALPGCEHSVCKECFKAHFTHVIKEKEVKHFTCPVCGKPDMANEDITQGVYLEIFVHLIHEHLEDDMYKLCLEKLRDFNLIKEQNFIWCANNECRSGFIHEGAATYVQCPHCSKLMCRKCKKPWEPTHEGISCKEFARWKIDNDPNAQEQGLAAHLHSNGIECPQCHFKYDLARGGCMHFKCIKCPNEFCSGCGKSFKQGQECGKLDSCKNRGLHAHHPRDCLFYMRDFDVNELQGFLRKHNIPFDTEPKEKPSAMKENAAEEKPVEQQQEQPAAVVEPAAEGQAVPEAVEPAAEPVQAQAAAPGCRVMLQKETMDGLRDEECADPVVDGHAGLCKTHYKEYLVDLINKNKLDPVTMYPTYKITVMLTREEMAVPDRDDDDEDEDYREKLIQHVKEKLPLPNGNQEIGGGIAQANIPVVQPPPVVQPAPQPPAPAQ